MKANKNFVETIQHYQEALACLEVASQYLRCGEISPGDQDFSPSHTRGGETHSMMDLSPRSSGTFPSCFSSGYTSGGYGEVTRGPVVSSALHSDFFRPDARQPLRSYLSKHRESPIDFNVVEGLIERCASAITTIQSLHLEENIVVKDSLRSLMESLRFQKRLLEKKKRKFERTSSRCVAPAPPQENSDPITSAITAMRVPAPEGDCTDALQSVVGLQEVKDVLSEAFLLPSQFPHLFQGGALSSWSRLMLYGPPGTGKTKLARALAAELKCALYIVSPSMLMSSWLGETEKIIRELFMTARAEAGPVLVFLDEVDAFCRVRSSKEDDVTRRIKTELLLQLDSDQDTPSYNNLYYEHNFDEMLAGPSDNKLFVIAATNCPWDVDPAFVRRFQKRVYVDLPQSSERICLLQNALSGCTTSLSLEDWSAVGEATTGFSGADLRSVATASAFKPIKELHTATFWRFTDDNKIMPCSNDTLGAMQYTLDKLPSHRVTARPLCLQDLLSAIKSCQKSVSVGLLDQYDQYRTC